MRCMRLIRNKTLYKEAGEDELNQACALVSFTGMASVNIGGRTWHSFLGVGRHRKNFNSANDITPANKAQTRDKLKNLKVIIEDKLSLCIWIIIAMTF